VTDLWSVAQDAGVVGRRTRAAAPAIHGTGRRDMVEVEHPGTWCGVYPKIGDLAWLTRVACREYEDRSAWFRVIGVRDSTIAGWVYLRGWEVEERHRRECEVFARVEGLVIRRGYP
jgi:hypothetical protein